MDLITGKRVVVQGLILALVTVCVALVMSCMARVAYAVDNTIYWGVDGDTLYLSATSSEQHSNSTSGVFTNVSSIPWYSYRSDIRKVVIDGLLQPTSTAYWCYVFVELVEFDVDGNLDTSSVTNMSHMFRLCSSSLFNPDVSDWDTSNVTDMSGMFYNCYGDSFNPDVSHWDTSHVTRMGNMFYGCSGTAFNPDVSNWNTSSVVYMNSMFNGCSGLNFNPNVSGWNTSSVTSMNSMFIGCRGLLFNPDMSQWDTSNVTDMYQMFYNCYGISFNPDVSNWDVSKVTDMYQMFYFCQHISYLDLSNWDVSRVSSMNNMFSSCNCLSSVKFGLRNPLYGNQGARGYLVTPSSSFTTGKWVNLDNPDVGAKTSSELASMGPNLDVSLQGTWTWERKSILREGVTGGVSWKIDDDGKLTIWPTNGVTGVMSTAYPWGSNMAQAVTSVNVIGEVVAPSNCSKMFYDMRYCTSMDLSGLNTSNVTNMSYMFGLCNCISDLDLSNFNTSNVTDMNNMFYNCRGSSFSPNVSNWDVSNVTNMSNMFNGCSGSNFSVNCGNWDVSNVTDMSNMFYNCFDSAFNPDVSNWNTSHVTNMDSIFYNCSGSGFNPDVSNWNVSNVTNMSDMFSGCFGSSFNPDVTNWNTSNVTDMSYMYNNCTGSSFNPDVSYWDTSSVVDMTGMWNVRDPHYGSSFNPDVSHWDTSHVTSMRSMFYNRADSSFSPDLSNWDTSSVTNMAAMFYYNGGIRFLDLSSFDTSNVTTMSSMLYQCSSLIMIKLGPYNGLQGITSSVYATLPSANSSYTDNWINLDNPDADIKTSSQLVAMGPVLDESLQGTWARLAKGTTIVFDANGGNGVMEQQVITSGTSEMLHGSRFSLFDHDVVSWNTESNGSGTTYQIGQIIRGSNGGELLRLYAQWQQRDHVKTLNNGSFDVKVPAGYRLVIDNLPANAGYVINEQTPNGWELDTETNSSGNIPSNSTAIASFTNVWSPGSCSVRFVGTKSMDNAGAEADAFRFRLWEGSVLVEEVSNAAGGMIAFTPITYTDDNVGVHQYRIEEVIGNDNAINYDTHVENISVDVTGSGDSLSAEVTYDADGICFENRTVPGSLLLRKVIQDATNASENDEFDLGVRLLTPTGSGLGDISIQTRDAA